MSWVIRRLGIGDIDAVRALEQKIPEAPHWNRQDYERCIASDEGASPLRAGFVAEVDGNLVGFSAGKLVAGVCELESIAVATEARGQGIGAALLSTVAGWAQASGAHRIELEVRSLSRRAINLYERAGLRRDGLRAGYYHFPDDDALLMSAGLPTGGKLA
jgi:ribosomal-protein-alanine N-acetyltransferase